MEFTTETSSDGVLERSFTLGEITGVLWSRATGSERSERSERAPLVLMGHGGGQHKRAPGVLGRARHFVSACGFTVAAIDAPGHGGRPRTAADEQHVAALRKAQADGEPIGPIVIRYNTAVAARAVPEWRAAIDALQELPEIGRRKIGYWGLALGTAIGVPLAAVEPRITAAVFGGLGHESLASTAARVTVPLQFLLQWDDEHVERHCGLALFDAFGSAEKTLHANPGGHRDVPAFELNSASRFFIRHLHGATIG
jgi:dienelactone hydrolase